MRLDRYAAGGFDRGASRIKEVAWIFVDATLLNTWLPGSKWRSFLLKAFGARIGKSVVIKPRVHVKFPWRLSLGDYCWIGEKTWIDNLDFVIIGSHVCVSQGAYFCTGNHDWATSSFRLITGSIVVEPHSWVGAMAKVCPGSHLEEGSILTLGSVAVGRLSSWKIYSGHPAISIKDRPRAID